MQQGKWINIGRLSWAGCVYEIRIIIADSKVVHYKLSARSSEPPRCTLSAGVLERETVVIC